MKDGVELKPDSDRSSSAKSDLRTPRPLEGGYCEIKVKDHLALHWADWFAGLSIVHCEGGSTLLSGPVTDQAALLGLLNKVCDLGLTLLSIEFSRGASP